MPRTAKDKVSQAIEEAVVVEEAVPVDPLPAPEILSTPQPTDPEWQDYVLSKFDKSEFDPEGNPFAESCRVVSARLLGPTVKERVRVLQVPSSDNDYRATVEVEVHIAWGGDLTDVREFADVADVFPGNMDPRFAQFPTASAKTKALGRAYKSALMLRKVYTAEEMASKEVPIPGGGFDKLISLSQRRMIDKVCREININVKKFINSGERRYEDIIQIPYAKAERMIKNLNTYQQNLNSIPVEIKGYNES